MTGTVTFTNAPNTGLGVVRGQNGSLAVKGVAPQKVSLAPVVSQGPPGETKIEQFENYDPGDLAALFNSI